MSLDTGPLDPGTGVEPPLLRRGVEGRGVSGHECLVTQLALDTSKTGLPYKETLPF